jgi:hypothetical protein
VDVTVLRGNAGEVATLVGADAEVRGVESIAAGVGSLPSAGAGGGRQLGFVASVTGPVDHVSDGERTLAVANGHPLLAAVTGTGCISSALTGCFLAAKPEEPLEAAAEALAALGVAAEDAAAGAAGPGTFHARLYDALAALDPETLDGRAPSPSRDHGREVGEFGLLAELERGGPVQGSNTTLRSSAALSSRRTRSSRASTSASISSAGASSAHGLPPSTSATSPPPEPIRSPFVSLGLHRDRARRRARVLRRLERARRADARRRHDPCRPRRHVRDRARPFGSRAGPRGSEAR